MKPETNCDPTDVGWVRSLAAEETGPLPQWKIDMLKALPGWENIPLPGKDEPEPEEELLPGEISGWWEDPSAE